MAWGGSTCRARQDLNDKWVTSFLWTCSTASRCKRVCQSGLKRFFCVSLQPILYLLVVFARGVLTENFAKSSSGPALPGAPSSITWSSAPKGFVGSARSKRTKKEDQTFSLSWNWFYGRHCRFYLMISLIFLEEGEEKLWLKSPDLAAANNVVPEGKNHGGLKHDKLIFIV